MRSIYTEFFQKSPLLVFPLVGLTLFLLVFTMVLVRTLGKRGRTLQNFASMPLEGELRRSAEGDSERIQLRRSAEGDSERTQMPREEVKQS